MENEKIKMYRQGEILFIPCTLSEANRKSLSIDKKVSNGVIREGEVTGHFHALSEEVEEDEQGLFKGVPYSWGSDTKLPNGDFVLTSDNKIKITHPEHATVNLPKGDYVVRIQREYDEHKQFVQVMD